MKILSLMLAFIVFGSILSVSAQSRTVTNSDLEKYKQKRVAAEADLRENYAKLGFPSPEELTRRNAESARELEEFASKLRAERLEAERIESARRSQPAYLSDYGTASPEYLDPGAVYYANYRYGNRRPVFTRTYQQPGYFAGGQFWPTPVRSRPRPAARWLPTR